MSHTGLGMVRASGSGWAKRRKPRRKRVRRALVLLTAISTVFALVLPALAAPQRIDPVEPLPSAETGEFTDETPSAWFIELETPPTTEGGSAAAIDREHRELRDSAEDLGIDLNERHSFKSLWNGISAEITPGEVGKIQQLEGVKAVYPVFAVEMPEPQPGGNPDLATAIAMTGADIAQSELGYTGAGVKVAIMDTGIDYDNPDLGGAFGPGNRVAYGWDFVGDAYNADPDDPGYNPVPSPDPDPDDCQGHGTHVAGIVGADGEVVGVAPDVTFGAYRVFGCEGSTDTDIMLAAMEMALADGMDILNMSIGSPFTWPGYPTAVGANNMVDAGMIVVASIGNAGANGTFSAGAPGLGEKVIGVASFDNTFTKLPVMEADDESTDPFDIGYIAMEFADNPPTSGTEEIVYIGRMCTSMGDTPEADPTGKAALVARGDCSFAEKAEGAIAAGATSVVIHNNADGNFNGTLGATPSQPMVVVGISLAAGEYLKSLTNPTITWTDRLGTFPDPNGGKISSFSSWGLAPDLSLKPDLGAPGGNIYSTYPLEKGGHTTLSGTSMASPHVAGAIALLLQARPSTDVDDVRDMLQNNADPALLSGFPEAYQLLEHVHRQGAGMVDVDDTIEATTLVKPGKIALGETDGAPITKTITVYNDKNADVTYDLSLPVDAFGAMGGMASTGTMADELDPLWFTDGLVEMPDSVSVPAGGSTSFDVTFTFVPDVDVPDQSMFGSWITLTEQVPEPAEGEEPTVPEVLRVPFAGFAGDYQSLTVLEPNPYGMPWLSYLEDEAYNLIEEDGHVFTMEDGDIPYVLAHLHHQADSLSIDLYKASNNKPVHPIFRTGIEEELLPRNATSTGFFAWEWDGKRVHNNGPFSWLLKNVPNGDYYFVMTVEKALGDPDNPDHIETWESPVFTVDRPNPWLKWLKDWLNKLRKWRP